MNFRSKEPFLAVEIESKIEGSYQRDMRRSWLTVVGFEDGGKRPGNKKCGHPLEVEKARKKLFPGESRNEWSLADALMLAWWDLCWACDLQNYKILCVNLTH